MRSRPDPERANQKMNLSRLPTLEDRPRVEAVEVAVQAVGPARLVPLLRKLSGLDEPDEGVEVVWPQRVREPLVDLIVPWWCMVHGEGSTDVQPRVRFREIPSRIGGGVGGGVRRGGGRVVGGGVDGRGEQTAGNVCASEGRNSTGFMRQRERTGCNFGSDRYRGNRSRLSEEDKNRNRIGRHKIGHRHVGCYSRKEQRAVFSIRTSQMKGAEGARKKQRTRSSDGRTADLWIPGGNKRYLRPPKKGEKKGGNENRTV